MLWTVLLIGICLLPDSKTPAILQFGLAVFVAWFGIASGNWSLKSNSAQLRQILPLLAWSAWYFLAAIFSEKPDEASLHALSFAFMAIGAASLGQNGIGRSIASKLILAAALTIIGLIAVLAFPLENKAASIPFFTDTNMLSAALAFALFLTLPIIWIEKKMVLRLLAFSLSAMMLVSIFVFQSRGAWLSILALPLTLPFFFLRKASFKLIWALIIATSIPVFIILQNQTRSNSPQSNSSLSKLESITDTQQNFSNRERIMRWEIAIRMAKKHPLFGIGPGNYPKQFKFELRNQDEVERIAYWNGWKLGAHSDTLNILAESGPIGLLLFLLLLFISFRKINWRIENSKLKSYQNLFLLLAICTFLIHSLVNDLFSSPFLLLLFFFGIGQVWRMKRALVETT